MSDEKFELSRRKALIGAGTVGIASAGAGLGTTAYFSDQEEFTGNEIQAGEFGMQADNFVGDVDQDGIGQDELTFEADDDSLIVNSGFNFGDLKPGDTIRLYWWFCIDSNPGYLAVAGSSTDENGVDAGNVSLDDLWDIDDEDDLSTIGEEAEATLEVWGSNDDQEKDSADPLSTVDYDSLNDLLSSVNDGLLVDDDDADPLRVGPDEVWQYVLICVKIHIPTSVGNEIQGAVTTADLTFYAEQARHNVAADVVGRAVDAHADGDNDDNNS